MKNIAKLFTLSLLLFLVACDSKDKQAEQDLMEQVMDVHDEVMPKMSEISKLRKGLKIQVDSLLSDELKANDEQAISLNEKIKNLEAASEGMMVWMRGFSRDFEGKSHEEIMDYLNNQKLKADKVKADMLGAIEETS